MLLFAQIIICMRKKLSSSKVKCVQPYFQLINNYEFNLYQVDIIIIYDPSTDSNIISYGQQILSDKL